MDHNIASYDWQNADVLGVSDVYCILRHIGEGGIVRKSVTWHSYALRDDSIKLGMGIRDHSLTQNYGWSRRMKKGDSDGDEHRSLAGRIECTWISIISFEDSIVNDIDSVTCQMWNKGPEINSVLKTGLNNEWFELLYPLIGLTVIYS